MVMVITKVINKKWILFVLCISIIISLRIPMNRHNSSFDFPIPFDEPQDDYLPSLYLEDTSVSEIGLEYDFYRQSCPQAESIVRSYMARIFSDQNDVSAGLLRLFFHDCFIEGCDASVLLDDSNGNQNHAIERQAIPNRSLRGFDKIDMIKEELEKACPGIVSCSDILALATRDGIVLAGGPFYPVFTGRRDSLQSFFREAAAQIPRPSDNISQILNLFSLRGFDERDTVSLLGGHNIGKIGCQFIQDRIHNFSGTGLPDPSLASDFRNEIINTCENDKNSSTDGSLFSMRSRRADAFSQGLSSSMSLGAGLRVW
ncbi:putative Peroxidase 48 isoform X2 [Tripterygium wilfordii]|uniref:putative Peroxidase 48 isoform X2 n=1 Tax=Tripterygium wilfordii TaxID=458696 RepID=UPI0018F80B3D|nr:putative Peroxidase 48 isoform X2 [Tripterygium wilfordii]